MYTEVRRLNWDLERASEMYGKIQRENEMEYKKNVRVEEFRDVLFRGLEITEC